MQLHRKRLNAQFYADHLVARTKFLYGSTGTWVYTIVKFTAVYPVANRLEAGDTLRRYKENFGIPDRLRTDQAPEIMGKNTEFQPQAKRLHIDLTHTELERSNQNHGAEIEIGEFQKSFRQKMVRKQDPKRVWVYGLVHQAGVPNQISRGKTGRTGIEELTGKTPDISESIDFDFYGQVWWLDKNHLATTDDNITLR